jgi:lipid A 4'-phosphatase
VGTVAGFGAGLIRMAQGAHFPSDVVFAGVFMALAVAGLHRLVFGGRGARGALPKAPKVALPSRGP